jgi:rhomboid protease GluP
MVPLPLALLLLALGASLACGLLHAAGMPRPARLFPIATVAIAGLTAAAFLAQLRFPALLVLFERDAGRIAVGQAWRLATALLFQDGGIAGLVFNLAFLVALGPLAERRWGPARWLLLYFGGGIAAGLIALAWQPVGAGNSIAVLALAGALCASGLTSEGAARTAAAIALLCAVALVALRDIHGPALIVGALARSVMAATGRRPAAAA